MPVTLPTAIITPVRRSTRRSVTSLPAWLRDHDTVLETLDDLSPSARDGALYQANKALILDDDSHDDDGDTVRN